MFGLLGGWDDPRRQALLMAAAAALQPGAGGTSGAAGRAMQAGLMGYNQAGLLADRRKQEEQERAFRDMQMGQLRQQDADRKSIADIYSRNTMPGNLTPNDDMGNPMPAAPQGVNLPGLMSGLQSAGPAGMREAAAVQGMMPKPQALMNVPAGGSVFDPTTRQPVFQAPQKTPDWLDPRYVEVQSKIRAAGRPQVSVNTNMPPLEKKEQQDKGALNVKNFGDLQGAAAVARRENALLTGLEKIPLETGALTPANVTVSSWIAALGGGDKFKDVASQGQGFTAFAKDLVLQRQLAQKGPQTESDAKRLEQTVAQLGNTREANSLIVSFSKAINEKTIAQEKFFRNWWSKNKTYEGAEEAWFAGEGGKSIWDDERLKKYQNKAGGVTLRFDSQGNPR